MLLLTIAALILVFRVNAGQYVGYDPILDNFAVIQSKKIKEIGNFGKSNAASLIDCANQVQQGRLQAAYWKIQSQKCVFSGVKGRQGTYVMREQGGQIIDKGPVQYTVEGYDVRNDTSLEVDKCLDSQLKFMTGCDAVFRETWNDVPHYWCKVFPDDQDSILLLRKNILQ